jgi:hypothetical protein
MKVHMFRAVQVPFSPTKKNWEVAWIEILPVIKETKPSIVITQQFNSLPLQARKVSNFLFFSMSKWKCF